MDIKYMLKTDEGNITKIVQTKSKNNTRMNYTGHSITYNTNIYLPYRTLILLLQI